MSKSPAFQEGAKELRKARATGLPLFGAVGLFSAVVNLLMLTGPLFMMQVYDRVLASRSVETLTALFLLVVFLFLLMGLLDLARNLGISTVAEGIETPAQAAYLARKGCDVGQGYLFGRPMPAARVGELIEVWNAAAARSLIGSAAA